jgi:hypothetical protein
MGKHRKVYNYSRHKRVDLEPRRLNINYNNFALQLSGMDTVQKNIFITVHSVNASTEQNREDMKEAASTV